MQIKNKKIKGHIFVSVAIIIFVIISLVIFMRSNYRRIVKQNESYIADATALCASYVNNRFQSKLSNIQMISALYSNSLTSPQVDTSKITQLCPPDYFDFIEFISADGMVRTNAGTVADVSHKEAYLNGMKGQTGLCAVTDKSMTEKRLLSFYTPLYYDGEIIGVLCGLYDADGMQSIITNQFFGTPASIYLCLDDGTVLTSAGVAEPKDNLLEVIKSSPNFSEKYRKDVVDAFEKHESKSFRYQDKTGTRTAYIDVLDYNDWIIVQSLPSNVINDMRNQANRTGIILVCCIIAAFLVFISFLIWDNRRNQISLINENREISRIVESVTALFSRFAVADLMNDKYYYVAETDGMPEKGKYSELISYISNFYIPEENYADMTEVLNPKYIRQHLTEDVDYLQYEYHINRNDEDRWENLSMICLNRQDGKPMSVLYAVQNITELKQKELESRLALKNAFDSAKAANRAKSEFLSRMSHDIRTPMNAVMGMTAVAAMHINDKERLIDCLNKISSSSRHLLALINDILDMSKIESGKVTLSEEPFNLAEMTDSVLNIMNPQIKAKDQKFTISTSNLTHEDVIGDTLRLRQIFVNILGNAVKFTPVGGTITLDMIELQSNIPGKACYEFAFTDTGIGMEQSFIDKIFEPFSRSNNSDSRKVEGTGLGMAISKNIVNMMDGDIKVESKLGEGTKITVRLYLTIKNLNETDARCLENLKILVADDDEFVAENTREILNSIGMDATSVFSGEEAVDEVIRHHENNDDFSAVILDWQMPNKNGIQATAEIRQRIGSSVPIIILSAYDWSDIEEKAKDTGVNAFIAKPLFKSRLIYVLKSLISPDAEQSKTSEMDKFTENQYDGKRILLVEDNELNREIAGELLRMIGFEVQMAFDGKIAVEMLLSKPEKYYDLVFMDIQMPNMNGYEATKAIRAAERKDLKDLPIIAMSADAFSNDVYMAKESGMNDHISKPIDIPKLSETLKKWIK